MKVFSYDEVQRNAVTLSVGIDPADTVAGICICIHCRTPTTYNLLGVDMHSPLSAVYHVSVSAEGLSLCWCPRGSSTLTPGGALNGQSVRVALV